MLTVVLLLGCGSPKSDGFGGNRTADSTTVAAASGANKTSKTSNVGGNTSAGISMGTNASGSVTTASGSSSGASTDAVGGEGGADGEGGAASTDTSNTGVTYDPPDKDGGTQDPPIDGSTGDPPVGDTGDPPVGDTGDPPIGDTGDPPIGDTADPPEGCTMTEIDKVNVIVFGDATPAGADVEGKMWVGGNATFSGYGIGVKEASATLDCTKVTEYNLVVGGDLSGQVNVSNGLVAVYGKNLGSVTSCGNPKAKPVDFATIEKKLKGYSAAFRDYPANGTATSNSGLILKGTDPELNVFSITAAQLTQASQITISVPANSSVVVNVSGKEVMWTGAGFKLPDGGSACRGGTSDWCHRIMWNFYEATTLELGGIGVQGSVTAPYAKVSGGGGNIDGQLIAAELTGGIEYHPYFFSGCLLLPNKV